MCGFAGGSFSSKKMLEKISRSIQKRSKGTPSYYVTDELSFFHAPLKLTDIHLDTDQPYITERLVVGLVGEIYNKQYLLELIHIDGQADISEVELIAKCYETLGIRFVDYLNGEFVIFIFDKNTQTHYLFRDRYGVHAVYYTVKDNVLYFSSHLQDLSRLHSQENTLSDIQGMLDYYIFGFSVSPHTFVPHVHILEAGSCIEFQNGSLKNHSFGTYMQQSQSKNFIDALEQSVIRRIPKDQKKIFMPISGGADSNLVLYFLHKHFRGEIIPYTFSNKNNQEDVKTAISNMKQYGLNHKVIEVDDIQEYDYQENIILHEGLVNLYDMSGKLRELHPEYNDVHIEFSGDGREELLQVNSHFKYEEIQKRYEYIQSKGLGKLYDIDNTFLNTSMFDFNLQLIEKLTLGRLIERRLPFTDYDLLKYTGYQHYSLEAQKFLKEKGIQIVQGIYGHNTGIYFEYIYNTQKQIEYIKYFYSQYNKTI